MLDRNALDNYITGHYGEGQFRDDEPEEIEPEDIPMTPERAIRSVAFDLRFRRRDFEGKPDPHGVIPHIDQLIAALEQAQRDLADYRKVKAALAMLRSI